MICKAYNSHNRKASVVLNPGSFSFEKYPGSKPSLRWDRVGCFISGTAFPILLPLPEILLPETLSFQFLSVFEGKLVNHLSSITITTKKKKKRKSADNERLWKTDNCTQMHNFPQAMISSDKIASSIYSGEDCFNIKVICGQFWNNKVANMCGLCLLLFLFIIINKLLHPAPCSVSLKEHRNTG